MHHTQPIYLSVDRCTSTVSYGVLGIDSFTCPLSRSILSTTGRSMIATYDKHVNYLRWRWTSSHNTMAPPQNNEEQKLLVCSHSRNIRAYNCRAATHFSVGAAAGEDNFCSLVARACCVGLSSLATYTSETKKRGGRNTSRLNLDYGHSPTLTTKRSTSASSPPPDRETIFTSVANFVVRGWLGNDW